MATVHLESIEVLYGGFVGHIGTRVVTVSLAQINVGANRTLALAGEGGGSAAPVLSLSLEVIPDQIYANLMPPIRRPQPHKFAIALTVTNTGTAAYHGTSPDAALARFAVLDGRTEIWKWPDIVSQVVTNVKIDPGQSVVYNAVWEMNDAVKFVGADLTVVGRFVPNRASAMHSVEVKTAH